jgi:hypothetical protein
MATLRAGCSTSGAKALRYLAMPTSPAYVCSMCRKPIAVGAKVIKCAVSTCNTGRVKLVFCSASCWDSHLPNARHRTAYFVEEIARRE